MKLITTALLKAQKEMGNAKKDSVNPFFKSKYSDLNSVREAVIPLLNENGIVVMQPMVTIDGNEYVKTILLHESGELLESFTKILCKAQNDPQAYGSGVTYARRYGLQSLVCIGAEDDDANQATKEPQKVKVPTDQLQKAKQAIEAGTITREQAINKLKANFNLTEENIKSL